MVKEEWREQGGGRDEEAERVNKNGVIGIINSGEGKIHSAFSFISK